ncbi:lipoprotein [Streptomyces viridochromogenes]|uniref:Lipoprotein n=1 Tax=Streptomyces viridochromogenes TaxID=1938 RepID=A0A0L8J0R2_STRVR|nr:lipoprotein [Streptomyces viridochromogenes]
MVTVLALASVTVGCKDTGGGGGSAPEPGKSAGASKAPGKGKGKESAKPSPTASKKPTKPGKGGSAGALTCDQLRNAPLQTSSFRFPDAPDGTVAFTDGRWEGDGVVIELQPQCGIGDMTGDPAEDAVAAVKVTTGGTGKFYGLVTWRNDAGSPVPVAAASLGDRTPVVSIDVSSPAPRQATVVYLTRGDSEPSAVVTIRRSAVYRVTEPTLTELHHSDTPYTP